MKRLKILFASLLVAGMANATDDVTVANVTVELGTTAQVEITLNSATALYKGFQFDLTLPEGIAPVLNAKGVPTFNRGTRSADVEEYNISSSVLSSGAARYLCAANTATPFAAGNDVILSAIITVDAATALGEYAAKLSGIEFNTTDNVRTLFDDVNFTITVVERDTHVLLDETSTTAPEPATGVDVRVKRTISAGEWNTICLPFAMTQAQTKTAFGNDVQLADFTGYVATENNDEEVVSITVNFEDVTAIEANHPYIIKVAAPVTEFTVDRVDINPVDEPINAVITRTRKAWSEMVGTYTANFKVPELALFLNRGKLWYSTGLTKMKAYRAYFDFYDVLTEVENANVKMVVNFGDEDGMEEIQFGTDTSELIYDLSGRRIKKAEKGIYIINNKKVLVK